MKSVDQWWRPYDIVSMIDPASGQQERNCESAIVTVGGLHRSDRDEIYVLDARAGHWKDLELLNQMYLVHDIYHPDHVGIESATHQQWMVTMSQLSQDRPADFRLRPHNSLLHGRKKKHRLQKAADWIRNVRFKKGCSIQDRLVDQLVTYREGDKFDLGDAFCMAVNEYVRLFPVGLRTQDSRIEIPKYDRTGRIVGYYPI